MDPEAKQALKVIARALAVLASDSAARLGADAGGRHSGGDRRDLVDLFRALAILDEMEKKA